ncbi:MAG: glutaredoxin 3 [Psychromonas sp.]
MATVIIYSTARCPYCIRAKQLLDNKNIEYTDIDVSEADARAKMTALTAGVTVPQIVISGQAIGGCDELYALEFSRELDKLLV